MHPKQHLLFNIIVKHICAELYKFEAILILIYDYNDYCISFFISNSLTLEFNTWLYVSGNFQAEANAAEKAEAAAAVVVPWTAG